MEVFDAEICGLGEKGKKVNHDERQWVAYQEICNDGWRQQVAKECKQKCLGKEHAADHCMYRLWTRHAAPRKLSNKFREQLLGPHTNLAGPFPRLADLANEASFESESKYLSSEESDDQYPVGKDTQGWYATKYRREQQLNHDQAADLAGQLHKDAPKSASADAVPEAGSEAELPASVGSGLELSSESARGPERASDRSGQDGPLSAPLSVGGVPETAEAAPEVLLEMSATDEVEEGERQNAEKQQSLEQEVAVMTQLASEVAEKEAGAGQPQPSASTVDPTGAVLHELEQELSDVRLLNAVGANSGLMPVLESDPASAAALALFSLDPPLEEPLMRSTEVDANGFARRSGSQLGPSDAGDASADWDEQMVGTFSAAAANGNHAGAGISPERRAT